jgi:hypothetical protein
MSDAQSHTISTQYGEAEINVYECDSCGNTIAYENTVEFTLGDREGRACEHCAETGPISFPERVIEWSLPKDESGAPNNGLLVNLFGSPLLLPLVTIGGFIKSDQFAQGYATAIITVLAWASLLFGLMYFL